MDHQEPDQDALVAAVRAGRSEAFRPLFDATYQELRLFVAARADAVEMTDEVVQATYVAAFSGIARFETGGCFIAWLKGIARNLLRRERERRGRLQPMADAAVAPTGEVPAPPDDLGLRLDRCLERLSPAARQLVALRYRERVAVQDIAQRLGRTPSSVSVSLHRIRESLADCLGPEVMVHV